MKFDIVEAKMWLNKSVEGSGSSFTNREMVILQIGGNLEERP